LYLFSVSYLFIRLLDVSGGSAESRREVSAAIPGDASRRERLHQRQTKVAHFLRKQKDVPLLAVR